MNDTQLLVSALAICGAVLGYMVRHRAESVESKTKDGDTERDRLRDAQGKIIERIVALETRQSAAPNAADLTSLRSEIAAVQNSVGRLEGQYKSIADQVRAIYDHIIKSAD